MNAVCRGVTLGIALALSAGCPPGARSKAPPPSSPGASSQPAGPAPEIVLPDDHFDAGTVKQGTAVKHTFVVQNRGLGTLNIEKVKGS